MLFLLFYFSITAVDSHGTLHLAFGLIGMHSTAACIWVVTMFLYSSFEVCLSDVTWRVSNLFLKITVYLLLMSQTSHIIKLYLFVSYFCFDPGEFLLRWFCDQKIFPQKKNILHTSQHDLSNLVYKYIIELWFWVICVGVNSLLFRFWNLMFWHETYSQVKNLLDIYEFCLANCVSRIYHFHLCLLCINVSTNYQNCYWMCLTREDNSL